MSIHETVGAAVLIQKAQSSGSLLASRAMTHTTTKVMLASSALGIADITKLRRAVQPGFKMSQKVYLRKAEKMLSLKLWLKRI